MKQTVEARLGCVKYVFEFPPTREIVNRRVYDTEKAKRVASYVTDYFHEGELFYHRQLTVFQKKNGEKFVYLHHNGTIPHIYTGETFKSLQLTTSGYFSDTLSSIEELERECSPICTYDD